MRALTVVPLTADSARLEEREEPRAQDGSLLVEALALGICGTDVDILKGLYGFPSPGKERLVLGHESLGRVLEAPAGSGFSPGDLVAGFVRRPDPVPCFNCARGEWDMCRNGQYTERGIKGLDGYGAERFTLEPAFAVKVPPDLASVGVLVEPTSVVAKAWEQIERIGKRMAWRPARALVTGAGPIGLLAALLAKQRGLEVHVLDRRADGPKPSLVRDLGAVYHTGSVEGALKGADVVIECTGASSVIWEAMTHVAPDGIVCLTGVSSGGRLMSLDVGLLNRNLVLENNVIFGSVNANRRHYGMAVEALAAAPRQWLERIITRRLPLDRWRDAVRRDANDIKPIIDFTQTG